MIPLMRNTFINEFSTKTALANFIKNSEILSMNTQCSSFEISFAQKQDRDFAVLFNSGGSANLALLQALKNLGRISEGDKIGFSALTWSTNVMPIIQMGCIPVAIDCEIDSLNVSSKKLTETLKKEKLKMVFLTNALGFVDDIWNIKEICDLGGIILIEDNCESLGTETPYGKTGNFGVASTFSFFVGHHMSTIEGGMVCSDDDELVEMLKIVRANGWDRNLTLRQQRTWRENNGVSSEFEAKYTFYDLGYNLRPTEITGFLGLNQLPYLDASVSKRKSNYMLVEFAMQDNPDFICPKHNRITKLSSFAIPVICKTPELRKKYLTKCADFGVETRPMIAGNIQNQPFYSKYVLEEQYTPNSDFLHTNSFYCGNYPEMTENDLKTIRKILTKD
jgi:CDP-6-deoxy-D-xylo-4-hexulose-3-dehydrase